MIPKNELKHIIAINNLQVQYDAIGDKYLHHKYHHDPLKVLDRLKLFKQIMILQDELKTMQEINSRPKRNRKKCYPCRPIFTRTNKYHFTKLIKAGTLAA